MRGGPPSERHDYRRATRPDEPADDPPARPERRDVCPRRAGTAERPRPSGGAARGKGEDLARDVLVIGGGIAGIQASLDLAEMGIPVHLVEKSPSIGGVMAQLDKTFPTNDCSI